MQWQDHSSLPVVANVSVYLNALMQSKFLDFEQAKMSNLQDRQLLPRSFSAFKRKISSKKEQILIWSKEKKQSQVLEQQTEGNGEKIKHLEKTHK